ncbi:MAG: ABC transporter ATP-binding protein/permease [Oscillospiraceae bacterium]|jgi:ATP-binding cassette subfamily B protein|nr:ABC transporter ATP-binding protein/permease [Oscillospiraceae bacterium]
MAKDKNKNMSFGQQVKNLIRTYKLVSSLEPGYISTKLCRAFMGSLSSMIVVFFSARVIDELTGDRDVHLLVIYIAVTVGAGFLLKLLSKVFGAKEEVHKQALNYKYELVLSEKSRELDYEYMEDGSVNSSINTVKELSGTSGEGFMRHEQAFNFLAGNVSTLLISLFVLSGMFITSDGYEENFFTGGWSLVIFVVFVIFTLYITTALGDKLRKIYYTRLGQSSGSMKFLRYYAEYTDIGRAGKDIRLYNQAPAVSELFHDAYFKNNFWKKVEVICGVEFGLSAACSSFLYGLSFLFVGLRALHGMYSIGSVVLYTTALTGVTGQIVNIFANTVRQLNNGEYMQKIFDFLDLPSKKRVSSDHILGQTDCEIEFKDVSFKYPGSESYALKNLSLKLNMGTKLAIVGMNGSGKTTMIKLLCRLYDPTEGVITINGTDIRDYVIEEYLALFSVVFQDFKLFSFTLGQNLAAAMEYDSTRAYNALEKVGFDERLNNMEDGLNTYLYKQFDEDGVEISGGEAQKAALARAIYRDTPFMVLDEPTAALDPLVEYEIYTRFNSIIGNKTAVYISHRLSSCRFCDDIAVFHEGKLVQQGSHDQLVGVRDGLYFELWNAQAQYYAD